MSYWEIPGTGSYSDLELTYVLRNDFSARHSTVHRTASHSVAGRVCRLQRGLPFYGNADKRDLLAIIEERAPDRVPTESCTSTGLLAILDELEHERTFFGFMHLPPELRVYIYEFAFSFLDVGYYRQQPAIARTCRLVRRESLPVFYQTNRFGFEFFMHRSRATKNRCISEPWPFHISQKHIKMMKHFEIVFHTNRSRLRIKIDLPNTEGRPPKIEVWSIRPQKFMTEKLLSKKQREVERQMRPMIEGLLKEPGMGNLGTSEIVRMALSAPEYAVP